MKLLNYDSAMKDALEAIKRDPRFTKAYVRLSECYMVNGDLHQAMMALSKANELEPKSEANKKMGKLLHDLRIKETLINKAYEEEQFEKAVTNLTAFLVDCKVSVHYTCLKFECLLKAYMFEDAIRFTNEI